MLPETVVSTKLRWSRVKITAISPAPALPIILAVPALVSMLSNTNSILSETISVFSPQAWKTPDGNSHLRLFGIGASAADAEESAAAMMVAITGCFIDRRPDMVQPELKCGGSLLKSSLPASSHPLKRNDNRHMPDFFARDGLHGYFHVLSENSEKFHQAADRY